MKQKQSAEILKLPLDKIIISIIMYLINHTKQEKTMNTKPSTTQDDKNFLDSPQQWLAHPELIATISDAAILEYSYFIHYYSVDFYSGDKMAAQEVLNRLQKRHAEIVQKRSVPLTQAEKEKRISEIEKVFAEAERLENAYD